MKKFYYVGLISILLFVLTGCLPKTNERVLFKPINPLLSGESSIISYTIKEEITTTQAETFTQRLNDDFRSNNILVKYLELKDFVDELDSVPESSNLWIEVNWYDYYDALRKGFIYYDEFIKPDGYNIYRSFDGIHYTKIGVSEYGYFLDPSEQNAPNKEVWYAVSSYTENGESTLVELGSVVPLDSFNVNLKSPADREKGVSRQPTFVWEPTKELTSPESEVEYYYTMWIYDLVQSENYILPGILEGTDVILYDFITLGAEEVSVTFLGSEGSSEYDNLSWFLYLPDGIYSYEYDKLEPAKIYDWGVDYAYAVSYDSDSVAYSIAIDYGWGIDPLGGVMPEMHNEFTTGN
ncbi:hypothetical protein [Petrotoga olearia]|uniref:Lipoprotein n=2 Tax=Petrotoga olearia TaxID=156203 RepID=A0A2K1P4M3_9BACT|nr:hypothetical protein [Petrotoga olearia]PNR97735.1 hypothetical protein X929_02195 [Petrotoga olearia DSM 13574]RMA75319.1 hypothetical protein C8D75_0842 [Petrotoga olearia]